MKQSTVRFYRFCKLCKNAHRWDDQIPAWPGWVFSTDAFLLETIISGRELWHRQNASDEGRSLTRRLQFYQRWVDPVILPAVRPFLHLLNWVNKFRSNDLSVRNGHLDEPVQPIDELPQSSPLRTMPAFCRLAGLEVSSDVSRNRSNSCANAEVTDGGDPPPFAQPKG